MSTPRLDETLIDKIASAITAGTFEDVAAEAKGVPAETYTAWLAKGQRPGARGLNAKLAEEVRTAKARARSTAEQDLLNNDPRSWLIAGPGRETTSKPGWSLARQTFVLAANDKNVELYQLKDAILAALEKFPEAKKEVAAALSKCSPELK